MSKRTWMTFLGVFFGWMLMASCLGHLGVKYADASDTIWLSNVGQQATGTSLGGGHYGLDINGNISFTEGATAAPGASPPALDKVIGGLGADSKIHTLATDNSGNLSCAQAGTWTNTVTQATGSNLHTQVDSSALPTGAATSALQTTGNTTLSTISGQIPSTLGQKAMASSLAVTIASDQSSIPAATGRSVTTTVRNAYGTTNVTSGAWVQLVASTSAAVNELDIFDSSGQTLELGTGAAASETRLILIYPGGNGRVPVKIAASTRVSIRAVSATASSGELDINFLQ